MDEKRHGLVLVSLEADFEDVFAFSIALEKAIRLFVGRQFSEGKLDKPQIEVRVEG